MHSVSISETTLIVPTSFIGPPSPSFVEHGHNKSKEYGVRFQLFGEKSSTVVQIIFDPFLSSQRTGMVDLRSTGAVVANSGRGVQNSAKTELTDRTELIRSVRSAIK